MNAATKKPETITETTLKTSLMSVALDELKAQNELWHKLSEKEQDEVITRIDKRIAGAIKHAVQVFATSGMEHVSAKLDGFTVKEVLKCTMTVSALHAHAMLDAAGQTVCIVLANPEHLAEQPHAHKADADQRQLDLDNALRNIGGSDGAQPGAKEEPEQPES